ncbi:hypothetical protein F53441_10625 [Fusarium austroafricanum]|uniref:P-loop containing nucleoside triphosphate hydrolase protein n=1 Tax=Fusarium austroafricanum TaxID=2364996 RepID=A0A8H4K940_9HYPO|nr:hypothetical protein F53441_10625 [Fusarium austroafricanum]
MSVTTTKPQREMQVLCLGLPRTGTASMAEALTVLGYKDVFHGLKTMDNKEAWHVLERATDASFPNLPSYTGKPFTREEWDEVWGSSEATTDVASVYAPQLIEIYPDAMVILVIRDFDPWFKSIDEGVLQQLWNPIASFSISVLEPLLGSRAGVTARKQMLGLFQADTVEEARKNAKETYERHHRTIREMVDEDQLLEYRMGDGWEPICEFLEKPVPEQEFPHVNEAAELRRLIADKIKRNIIEVATVAIPWIGGVAAMGAGFWVVYRR